MSRHEGVWVARLLRSGLKPFRSVRGSVSTRLHSDPLFNTLKARVLNKGRKPEGVWLWTQLPSNRLSAYVPSMSLVTPGTATGYSPSGPGFTGGSVLKSQSRGAKAKSDPAAFLQLI